MDEWEPFEHALFETIIRTIAEAFGELPSAPMSVRRQQFHAMMGHCLLDSVVGGDADKAVELTRKLYAEEASLVRVLAKQ